MTQRSRTVRRVTTVMCVPQWQGSSAQEARRLVDGAHRAAALVPADTLVTAPVLADGGDIEDGVRALSVLTTNLLGTQQTHAAIDDLVITVGGDCGVDLAPIAAARARHGSALTVLWIDAHQDLFHPTNLRSFHGMVVRTLLGDGPAALVPAEPLAPSQLILAGIREGEPVEYEYAERMGLRRHGVADLADAFENLTGPVYVHIDLDVLEPTEFASTCYPVADGVRSADLAALVSTVDNLVGGALTEHAPAPGEPNAAEAEVIRRLGAALVR